MITSPGESAVRLASKAETVQRFPAIDVLRGLTVALMVIVNSPGDGQQSYGPLKHAVWHGFTITDLVFPTFLFVVGNALSFTLKKFDRNNDKVFLAKIFRRTVIIFSIGVFLNAYPFISYIEPGTYNIIDITAIRVAGVLQRIALCYCVASIIIYYTGFKGAAWYCFISLLGYWLILYLFGDQPDPYGLESNAVSKLDILIIGAGNLYHGEGIPFDPEGLLSTLPAVVNVIAGYFVGIWIQRRMIGTRAILQLIAIGALLIVFALLWDTAFPINKKIWTSPYVLLTVGLDTLIISALLYFIDIRGMKKWTWFFEVFGRNPLVLYAFSYMIIKSFYVIHVNDETLKSRIYNNAFLPWATPAIASLIFAVSIMMIVWMVGYWMDAKRIYLKV